MSKEFNDCVKKRKLVKYGPGPRVASNKLKEAKADLAAAKDGYKMKVF